VFGLLFVDAFVLRLFLGGTRSEPIYIEVFVRHKGPGNETRKDERISYECRI